MKTKLVFGIIAIAFIACRKENFSASQNKTSAITLSINEDPRIGTIIKWRCVGGDTLFNDTLKLKLESVSLSGSKKQEQYFYTFNYPVWNYSTLCCSEQDLTQMNTLNFTSPDCKTVYFKLIK